MYRNRITVLARLTGFLVICDASPEHFREKWTPFFVKKMREIKKIEHIL